DPALRQRMAAFKASSNPPSAPYVECMEYVTRGSGAPEYAGFALLVFRNGRLDAAFQPVYRPVQPTPKSAHGIPYKPPVQRTNLFVANAGELPLEDGIGFVSRWHKVQLSPTDKLSASCGPPPPPPSHGSASLPWFVTDPAGIVLAVVLAPFWATLPPKNHQRAVAYQQGSALLGSLHVGGELGAAPQTFAAHHPGVRAYPAKAGDYTVLSIDLGGYPTKVGSTTNDAALVGVRKGRIEWISPPGAWGPQGDALCLGDEGAPYSRRRGCTGPYFSPND
ncbi:MAG TPA: hypothetical protein VKU60_17165, partial [Chloroflexota bacterium]|nr:hypothetical protein [Chloroflexota bacterium]